MKKIEDKIMLSNLKILFESKGLFEPFESWVKKTLEDQKNQLLVMEKENVEYHRGRAAMLQELLQEIQTIKNLKKVRTSI